MFCELFSISPTPNRKINHTRIILSQALLHGDLHTGSFMTAPESTLVLDAEFAFMGPMGFDIGAILGNILIAFFASAGREAETGEDRSAQRAWLLETLRGIWTRFEAKATAMVET